MVDEIQAQYQLPTSAGILSTPALQIWTAGVEDSDDKSTAEAIQVGKRLN